MGSFSNYLELELLDHVYGCGNRNYTPPSSLYVGLSTTDPTDAGTGITEPSGGGYARVQTGSSDWTTAASGALSNANVITFPEASASWGTPPYFFLADAASGGNMLGHGAITTPQAIASGQTARFPVGDLDTSLD